MQNGETSDNTPQKKPRIGKAAQRNQARKKKEVRRTTPSRCVQASRRLAPSAFLASSLLPAARFFPCSLCIFVLAWLSSFSSCSFFHSPGSLDCFPLFRRFRMCHVWRALRRHPSRVLWLFRKFMSLFNLSILLLTFAFFYAFGSYCDTICLVWLWSSFGAQEILWNQPTRLAKEKMLRRASSAAVRVAVRRTTNNSINNVRLYSSSTLGSRLAVLSSSSLRASPCALQQASRTAVFRRAFAAGGGALTQSDVEARVINVIKNMEKIDESVNVTADSHWLNDLGLDSLDAVEVVMAIEDEFSIEISDEEMEKMQSTRDAIQLVLVCSFRPLLWVGSFITPPLCSCLLLCNLDGLI